MSTASKAVQRVVVVGGGVIGVSVAAHLQRDGASVVLVTESELASGASGRSLSWLNSAGSRSAPYHALRMAGIDRYRTLAASGAGADWLRFDGGLFWADDDGAERRHRHEVAHGYDSRLLAPADVPGAAGRVRADAVRGPAVFNPGEGWVSLPHLIDHLVQRFTDDGGTVVTGAGRASVVVDSGAAVGVTTERGRQVDGDVVVIACGAATPAVVAELGVTLPDASPLSMLVTTEPIDAAVTAVLNTPRVALRPNPGGTYVLDHSWYESRIVEDPDGTCRVDEAIVAELVDEASAVLDGPSLKAASWKLGRKPIPGDGEPVFGELTAVPGCFVAFTHSGATLGLAAGELVSFEVLSGQRHPMLEPFRPERFEHRPR